jgi:hypothetical protein
MLVLDFAKNYAFIDFNEIQEMHRHSFQLTILVHICYRWNPDYIQNLCANKLIMEYHY